MDLDSAHTPNLSAPPPDFLLGMEARLHPMPWRPVAAWSVLAAGLATGILAGRAGSTLALGPWPTLLLCGLLADGLWGGIWRGLTGFHAPREPQPKQASAWRGLPYLQPNSPAARLLGSGSTGDDAHNLRAALPVLLAALVLAGVLGPAALILTGGMVLLAGFAWLATHNRSLRLLPWTSAATVLLPWALVLLTLNGADEGNRAWLLAGLWTLHVWGASRRGTAGPDRIGLGLMALATLGMAALLILVQAPLGLAVLAALWLPAWLLTVQDRHPQWVSLLWTASMLVSALTLGSAL